jgi:hypothetical protein
MKDGVTLFLACMLISLTPHRCESHPIKDSAEARVVAAKTAAGQQHETLFNA